MTGDRLNLFLKNQDIEHIPGISIFESVTKPKSMSLETRDYDVGGAE